MNQTLIHHSEGNRRLILIFAGWSTGPELYTDVRREGWDVMVCHDYTDIKFDKGAIAKYDTIYLYAWSLGVFVASLVLDAHKITAAYAINGTLSPVDDSKGIPAAIFEGTAMTLNEANLKKFRMRMFGGARNYAALADKMVDADIESLRQQLFNIQRIAASGQPDNLQWRRAYISDSDLIFPTAAQHAAWAGKTEIINIAGSHYLPVSQVVNETLVDNSEVERHFTDKSSTYDHNAVAQKLIAGHLADLWKSNDTADGANVLEIGCGTGMLTSLYARFMPEANVTFVDICQITPFRLFKNERYVKADAQLWLETQADHQWRYIVSSSAIQWLPDVGRFFADCARVMTDDGMLVMSSYVKGNMPELEPLGPVRLHYHTADELTSMLNANFDEVNVSVGEERVWFSSPLQLLRHVVMTGVGAARSGVSAGKIRGLMSAMKADETGRYPLTYKPVYIIASKPRH